MYSTINSTVSMLVIPCGLPNPEHPEGMSYMVPHKLLLTEDTNTVSFQSPTRKPFYGTRNPMCQSHLKSFNATHERQVISTVDRAT